MKSDFKDSSYPGITFAEFYFLGALAPEKREVNVRSRDVTTLSIPDGAYGFRFFDRTEVVSNGETLKGEQRNRSGFHVLAKRLLNAEQAAREPDSGTMVRNMKNNDCKFVAETKMGNFVLVSKDTVVLDKDRKVLFPSEELKAKQARLDDLVENKLQRATYTSLPATIAWIKEYASLADDPAAHIHEWTVKSLLTGAGYRDNAYTGDQFVKGDKDVMGKYIIGQVINCLNAGMPLHPMVKEFCDDYQKMPDKPAPGSKADSPKKSR